MKCWRIFYLTAPRLKKYFDCLVGGGIGTQFFWIQWDRMPTDFYHTRSATTQVYTVKKKLHTMKKMSAPILKKLFRNSVYSYL